MGEIEDSYSSFYLRFPLPPISVWFLSFSQNNLLCDREMREVRRKWKARLGTVSEDAERRGRIAVQAGQRAQIVEMSAKVSVVWYGCRRARNDLEVDAIGAVMNLIRANPSARPTFRKAKRDVLISGRGHGELKIICCIKTGGGRPAREAPS